MLLNVNLSLFKTNLIKYELFIAAVESFLKDKIYSEMKFGAQFLEQQQTRVIDFVVMCGTNGVSY